MEKRIELEKRGRNPAEIKELNLDNCRSTSIIGLTDEFSNLETLSLSNVGLTSLKGFPKLPNLKKLELSDNRISNGLNLLETSPKLTHLNLSNNRIKEFATLEPLKNLKNLINLDLFNNEATSIENYREKICKMIPTLQYLDGYDLHDGDTDDDEVNGNDNDDDSEDDASSVEDEEDGCNLRMVYEPKIDDTSDDEADYEVGEEDEDDDIVEEEEFDDTTEEEAQSEVPRGKKRKLEDGEGN